MKHTVKQNLFCTCNINSCLKCMCGQEIFIGNNQYNNMNAFIICLYIVFFKKNICIIFVAFIVLIIVGKPSRDI